MSMRSALHFAAAGVFLGCLLAPSTAQTTDFYIVQSLPNTLVVDGGYLHDLAPGMRADAFLISDTALLPGRKAGTLEIQEISAYESKCWFSTPLTLPEIAGSGGIYPVVDFAIPTRTADDLKCIAESALSRRAWGVAEHYLTAYLEIHPRDQVALAKRTHCRAKITDERNRKPTAWEATAGEIQRIFRIALAASYIERGKYAHARAKLDEIFFIYSRDPVAEAMLDRVQRLESLPPDLVYYPDLDPDFLSHTITPAWPLPGQKPYLDLQEAYRAEGFWSQFHVLVDERGKPLVIQTVGASGNTPQIPNLVAGMYRTDFSPCLRDGIPVIAWAEVTIGEKPIEGASAGAYHPEPCPIESDPHSREVLLVRLIESNPAIRLLLIVDGGYSDGLHDNMQGFVQTVDSAGEQVVVADIRIIDVDQHQAWCEAVVRPGTDPRITERACAGGQRIEFPCLAVPADSLQELAVIALGNADYETAAAFLSRSLANNPDQPSAVTALDHCLKKLSATENRALTETDLAYERTNLELYLELIVRYCLADKADRLGELPARVFRLRPDCIPGDPCLLPATCRPEGLGGSIYALHRLDSLAREAFLVVAGASINVHDPIFNNMHTRSGVHTIRNSRVFNPYLRHPAFWPR